MHTCPCFPREQLPSGQTSPMALGDALAGWTSAAVGPPCAVWQPLAGTDVSFSTGPATSTLFEGNGNLFWCDPLLVLPRADSRKLCFCKLTDCSCPSKCGPKIFLNAIPIRNKSVPPYPVLTGPLFLFLFSQGFFVSCAAVVDYSAL